MHKLNSQRRTKPPSNQSFYFVNDKYYILLIVKQSKFLYFVQRNTADIKEIGFMYIVFRRQLTIVTLLEYCRYCVKSETINKSRRQLMSRVHNPTEQNNNQSIETAQMIIADLWIWKIWKFVLQFIFNKKTTNFNSNILSDV